VAILPYSAVITKLIAVLFLCWEIAQVSHKGVCGFHRTRDKANFDQNTVKMPNGYRLLLLEDEITKFIQELQSDSSTSMAEKERQLTEFYDLFCAEAFGPKGFFGNVLTDYIASNKNPSCGDKK
jgi:hypothetical protein